LESDPAGRLHEAEAEARRLHEAWLRAEAELANFRRRAGRDVQEAETRARERVLTEMMSLADDLERALDAAEQAEKTGPIYEGVHLVHGRIRDILRAHGVEVIDPAGRPFDPFEAEALLHVESDQAAPGTVLDVIEKGYRQGARLLRPARVTVARAPQSSAGGSTPA
jgi:molecular chaperone GrpE